MSDYVRYLALRLHRLLLMAEVPGRGLAPAVSRTQARVTNFGSPDPCQGGTPGAIPMRRGITFPDHVGLMPRRSGGVRVLVVDDYPDAADSMAMLLRLDGYDVDVAVDGMAALQQA